MEIEIDVEGTESLTWAIREGFQEGLKDSGKWLRRKGVSRGKDAILSADRIWRGKLREGFETDGSGQMTRTTGWKGSITNTAPHAELNESGLKPGSSPSIQTIAPWVDDQIGSSLPRVTTNSYNIENWDPELAAQAEIYSPGVVITSFAVKNKLEDEGYEGIGFMETVEQYLQSVGPIVVRRKVEKELRKSLRRNDVTN